MRVSSVKWMRDILPSEIHLWQFIESAARDIFEKYGYREIRTPILEETALFQKGIGEGTDIVNKEMYTFTDRGDRSLTMRPEGTAPIVRSYIENNLANEGFANLYYIGPMFRSERPQKVRSRQFHQIGIEAIGSSSPYVDISVIQMMTRLFRRLGLEEFKIRLCSLGCLKDKQKLAEKLREYLAPERNRLCDDCKVRLKKNVLRTLDCKVESCRALLRNSPKAKDLLCESCSVHYNTLKKILNEIGIDFIEDPNMVRGLDYYTNTVFEVTHPGLGAQDAIAAGGRYDDLVRDFGGRETGAFGFAIGVERLLMAISHEGRLKVQEAKTDVYIASTGDEMRLQAFKTAGELVERGISCEMDFENRSLKSQMKQADRKKASLVVIFGEDELKKGEVVLRDMKTGSQRNVRLSELTENIKMGM